MNKYFYPHIPPSWVAASPMEKVAGKTFYWGSELFSQSPDNPKNAKTDEKIEYVINSLGYREAEFEESYNQYDELFLGFGNSSTAGTGVHDKDIFLRVIERNIPNSRVLNLSIAKGAPDSVARMVACTVPYFKPLCKKLSVIIMWPQDVRREVFLDNHHESVTAYSDEPYPGYFFGIDDTSCKYNRDKNKHIVDLVCQVHQADLFTVPYHLYTTSINPDVTKTDSARDGVSPSEAWHEKFADAIFNQIKMRDQGKLV
jgi:hypothetical protein